MWTNAWILSLKIETCVTPQRHQVKFFIFLMRVAISVQFTVLRSYFTNDMNVQNKKDHVLLLLWLCVTFYHWHLEVVGGWGRGIVSSHVMNLTNFQTAHHHLSLSLHLSILFNGKKKGIKMSGSMEDCENNKNTTEVCNRHTYGQGEHEPPWQNAWITVAVFTLYTLSCHNNGTAAGLDCCDEFCCCISTAQWMYTHKHHNRILYPHIK